MKPNCIHRLVEAQAARTPHADAIVFEDLTLSYDELNRRANQVAHYLRGRGAGPETLVGICLHRTPDIIVGMLGILKAGGAYVGIDPAYPKARQAFIIEDASMPILLTQRDLVHSLPVMRTELVCLDSDRSAIERESGANPDVPVDSGNLAYILYTSGSTGRPKGVAIEHRSVVAFLEWARAVFSAEELAGTLAGTSICFDLSVFEIFVPLACGGTIILAENAVALPTLAARSRVTLINTVPSAMSALIGVGGVPDSVRVVNLAGEPLPNKLAQDIYAAGSIQKVYNLYGPSEDTTYSTYALAQKGVATKPTIGVALDGTETYIVDDRLQLVEPGTPGELCLSGVGLARGYLNRPELTAEKFLRNPFGEGRLYRTGDLVRLLPDGNIDFLGRLDHQVKVRGFRIELGEIETVLEQHPAVDRAVVLALPDSRGDLQLVSYLTADSKAMDGIAQSLPTKDSDEHIKLWANVYEQAYAQNPQPEDITFNTSGWVSSYTGQSMPTGEMREWLSATVQTILDLKPRAVLELGCGTGMILARVAPHCERYVGVDISPTALEMVRAMQKSTSGLDGVSLYERAADDLSGLEPGFDLVIINSVIQHFPDADYLTKVLQSATTVLRPGGHIFVGDVLSLPLHDMFVSSVQMFRAADGDTCAELKRRIGKQLAQERDLMVAPAYFTALMEHQRDIGHVEIRPKRGTSLNQLTRFRYDTILHVGEEQRLRRGLTWIDWKQENLTLETLKLRLRGNTELAIRNIPNARLENEAHAMKWTQEADPEKTVGEFRSDSSAPRPKLGIEPEDLWAFAAEGYRVEISWINSTPSGAFDCVITKGNEDRRQASFGREGQITKRNLHEVTNHPQRAKLNRELIPQVRQYLSERLPNYMEPAVFMVLDKLPQTPTGKIDRRALAQLPVTVASNLDAISPDTENPLERLLVQAWTEALGIQRVGVDDNFFALGGNSLTAMGLTHRLQKLFNQPLRPTTLLLAPSVAQFAAYLTKTYPDLQLSTVGAAAVPEMEEGEI